MISVREPGFSFNKRWGRWLDLSPTGRLMWVVGLSYFGSGLIFAYSAIYLTSRTSLGLNGAALFFGAIALGNFGGAIVLSGISAPIRPGLLSGLGSVLLAVTYALVPLTRSPVVIAFLAVGIGMGRAAATVGITGVIVALADDGEQRTAFARRYRAMNVGIGVGSLMGSGLTALLSFKVLGPLFAVNGITFLPQAFFLLRRRSVGAVLRTEARPAPRRKHAFVLLLRGAGWVSLVQLGAYLLAFSQFEATAPLAAHELLGASLAFVALVVGLNTIAVVMLQKPFNSILGRYGTRAGVQIAVGFWVISYAVAGLGDLAGHNAALAGMLIFGVIFACGEAAYSCSYYPWLLSSVPAEDRSRAASFSNSMMSIGCSLGPSLGAVLVGTGSAGAVWGVLVGASLVFGMGIYGIRARPEQGGAVEYG